LCCRLKGETLFSKTDIEPDKDFILVEGLQPNEMYEFVAVALDGEFMTESELYDCDTYIGDII